MRVLVKAFATLREVLGSVGRVQLELAEGSNMGDLLNVLVKEHGKRFKQSIFKEGGGLASSVKILVNGREIEFLKGLETELKDGDEVAMIPPVAGGQDTSQRKERRRA